MSRLTFAAFVIIIMVGLGLVADQRLDPAGFAGGFQAWYCGRDGETHCADRVPCRENAACASGYCGVRGGGGPRECVAHSEQLRIGEVCNNDASCVTDNCDYYTHRCGIGAMGDACAREEDCEEGLACDGNRCSVVCVDSDGLDFEELGTVTYTRKYFTTDTKELTYQVTVDEDRNPTTKRDGCFMREVDGRDQLVPVEYWCDGREVGGLSRHSCQGRKKCLVEGEDCTYDGSFARQGQACASDNECMLGLLCNSGVCAVVGAAGADFPSRIGEACESHEECRDNNFSFPKVVCEQGICLGGLGSSCRHGCSQIFGCNADTGLCDLSRRYTDLPDRFPCRGDLQCDSWKCVGINDEGVGECAAHLIASGGVCRADVDCASGHCRGGRCDVSPEYGSCLSNGDCRGSLSCRSGLCLRGSVASATPGLAGCENYREVIPGWNSMDEGEKRINLIFVGVDFHPGFDFPTELAKLLNFGKHPRLGGVSFSTSFPLAENRDKFNFWYLNRAVKVDEARLVFDDYRACSDLCRNAAENAVSCPLERKHVANLCRMSCRSTAPAGSENVYVQIYPDPRTPYEYSVWPRDRAVLIHELAHDLPSLADEYEEEGKGTSTVFPNCAPSEEAADVWYGDLVGEGEGDLRITKERGCSYVSRTWRPSINSLMRDTSAVGFGAVNERDWCYSIYRETEGRIDARCQQILDSIQWNKSKELQYSELLSDNSAGYARSPLYAALSPGGVKTDTPSFRVKLRNEKQNVKIENKPIPDRPGKIDKSGDLDDKKFLMFDLVERGKGYVVENLEIASPIYIPYFEVNGIFDTEVTLVSGGTSKTKRINLRGIERVEDFLIPEIMRKIEFEYQERGEALPAAWFAADGRGYKEVRIISAKYKALPKVQVVIPLGGISLKDDFSIGVKSEVMDLSVDLKCTLKGCSED